MKIEQPLVTQLVDILSDQPIGNRSVNMSVDSVTQWLFESGGFSVTCSGILLFSYSVNQSVLQLVIQSVKQ
jgi:hypothetical protein